MWHDFQDKLDKDKLQNEESIEDITYQNRSWRVSSNFLHSLYNFDVVIVGKSQVGKGYCKYLK